MKKRRYLFVLVFTLVLSLVLYTALVFATTTLDNPVASKAYSATLNFTCTTDIINATNASLFYNSSGGAVGEVPLITIINSSLEQVTFSDGAVSTTSLTQATTYNFSCLVSNVTSSEWTTSVSGITIDFTYPLISITSPSNNENSSNAGLVVNYTVSDNLNLQACWYSNDTYSENLTLDDCANITTVTWAEGQHNVTIWANDSLGNVNSSSVGFVVDTTKPLISIVYPANTTYNVNVSALNYTRSDSNLAGCWYSLNFGAINSTYYTNCQNFTGLTSVEGSNTWTVYINDSVGHLNYTSVTFFKDTRPPYFTNLANQAKYNNQSLNYDINATDSGVGLGSFWINWTLTFSITTSTGVLTNTTALSIGVYYINVSINDTLGNLNSSIISVTVSNSTINDTTPPEVTIESPDDGDTLTDSDVLFSVSLNENGSCMYSINSGAHNYTMDSVDDNNRDFEETRTLADNDYTVHFYCEDNVGNKNYTENAIFYVDTSGGSGGDGGSGSNPSSYWTLTYNSSNFSTGYTKKLAAKNRIRFFVGSAEHFIGVVGLTSTTATINVSSTPQQAILRIGDEKKFDVTNDSYYDVYVKLNNITSSQANLTIRGIYERIPGSNITGNNTGNLSGNNTGNQTSGDINATGQSSIGKVLGSNYRMIGIVLIVIVVLVVIVVIALFALQRKDADNLKGLIVKTKKKNHMEESLDKTDESSDNKNESSDNTNKLFDKTTDSKLEGKRKINHKKHGKN